MSLRMATRTRDQDNIAGSWRGREARQVTGAAGPLKRGGRGKRRGAGERFTAELDAPNRGRPSGSSTVEGSMIKDAGRGGPPGSSPGRSRAAGRWVPRCGTWTVTGLSPELWG